MYQSAHFSIRQQLRQQLPLPPRPTHNHPRFRHSTSIMAGNDDDYEHWPSDSKQYTPGAPPAPGFDGNNGYHSHSYLVPKQKSASPAPSGGRADSKSPQPPIVTYPQPIYYGYAPQGMTHPGQQQYYSHPVQMAMQPAPQGYYPQYAIATPAPAPAPAPAPVAVPIAGNEHYYIPVQQAPKAPEPVPKANVWIGRTKAEVDADNMKLAKSENVYAPREFVPKMEEDQMCWVVELDKTHTLRYVGPFIFMLDMLIGPSRSMFGEAKELTGAWKEDSRYPNAFYFVRAEEKED